jgi:hypothetical protein
VDSPLYFLNPINAVDWLAIFYAWKHMRPLVLTSSSRPYKQSPKTFISRRRRTEPQPSRRFRIVTFPFIRYAILITAVLATILAASSIVLSFALTGGGPGFASTPATLYGFRVFFQRPGLWIWRRYVMADTGDGDGCKRLLFQAIDLEEVNMRLRTILVYVAAIAIAVYSVAPIYSLVIISSDGCEGCGGGEYLPS